MNVTKVTLWTTNIAITLAIIFVVVFVVNQLLWVNISQPEAGTQNVEGAISKTVRKHISNPLYDLEYLFVYRDQEVILDAHFISPRMIFLENNIYESGKNNFIEVKAQDKSYNMPISGSRVYIPIYGSNVTFYFYLSITVNLITALISILGLIWVRKLILKFLEGDFFNHLNYKIIRRLGMLFIIATISLFVVNVYISNNIRLPISFPTGFQVQDVSSAFEANYFYLGLMLLVTAQAFKQGINLQEEQDLTI
jgi:hypothetical protein